MPLSLGLLNLTEEELNLVDLGTFLPPGSGTLLDLTGLFLPGEFRDSQSLFEQVVVSGTVAISGSEGVLDTASAIRFFAGAQFAEQNFTVDGRDLRDIRNTFVKGNSPIVVTSGEDVDGRLIFTVDDSGPTAEQINPIAASGITFQASFTKQGASATEWLRVNGPVIPSNESPFIVPWDSQLDAITFINSTDGAAVDLEFHKSDSAGGATNEIFHNWSIQDTRAYTDSLISTSGIEFDAGDKIAVFTDGISPQTRPSDTSVTLYFRGRTTASGQLVKEDYVGDFS